MGYVRIPVQQGHPLFGKAVQCPCRQQAVKRDRAREMMRRSGLSQEMRERFTFAGFSPDKAEIPAGADADIVHGTMYDAQEVCQEYAKRPDGWLVLSGLKGCGKTHLAIAIAARQFAAARSVYYNTAIATLAMLRSGYENNEYEGYVKFLRTVDVLVLDDLGAERRNDWTDEQLLDVLNHRHLQRLPVVITTNTTGDDDRIAPRLRSRMREGIAVEDGFVKELVLPAGDYRPNVGYRKGGM